MRPWRFLFGPVKMLSPQFEEKTQEKRGSRKVPCTCAMLSPSFLSFHFFTFPTKKDHSFLKGDQNNSSFEFKPIYEQSTQLVKCASSVSLD